MKKGIPLLLASVLAVSALSACTQDKEPSKEEVKQEQWEKKKETAAAVSKEEKKIIEQFHPHANDWYEVGVGSIEEEQVRQGFVEAVQKHVGLETNISLDKVKGWDKQGSKLDKKDRFYWKPSSPELPVSVTLTKDSAFKKVWKDKDGYYLEANLIANADGDIERLNWYIHKNTFDILKEVSQTKGIKLDGVTIRWKVPVYKDKEQKVVTYQTFEDITLTMNDIKKVKKTKDIKAPIQSFGENGFFHQWAGKASFTPEFDKDHKDYGKYQLYKGEKRETSQK